MKIRNKRLAKLGSQAPAQSNIGGASSEEAASQQSHTGASNQNGSPKENELPNPRVNISKPVENSGNTQNPFSQLGGRQSNRKINIAPASGSMGSGTSSMKHGNPISANGISRAGDLPGEWEDKTLKAIFRLSLDPNHLQDSHGHRLHYMDGLRQELDEQGTAIQMTTGNLDQALLEVASNLGKTTPLEYLLGCWKRVSRQFRGLKPEDPRFNVVTEARRLCMSYCIFAITMPDMFGLDPPDSSPLTTHLLEDTEDDRGICRDFLVEAISRFDEDDTIQSAIVEAVEELSRQLSRMTMNDNYKPYIFALRNLVQYKPIVAAIAQSPLFLPPTISAATLEAATLLGPFFAMSPLQAGVTTNYFSSPKTRDRGFIANSQSALRMALNTHQTDLLDIVNHIVKSGEEPKGKMLDWFAMCVNANHKRRAIQVDQKTVSSDGFMINITVCLDQLCEPFMDATFSKIDRIDVDYLRRSPRIDIKEETKLNADQNASDRFYGEKADGKSNFISEVFFLTLAAHHYGGEATNSKLNQLEKDLKRMEKHIEEIELDRHKFVNDANRLKMFDAAIKRFKDKVDEGLSYKYAVQGVLLDDLSQARSMQFMRYVIVWLLRLVTPGQNFPKQALKLPLAEEQREVFRCLPEYFLEDVVGNFKFIMRNMPQIITSTQSDELVMLCISLLRSSEYVKNPYLKSGLVTIMYHGIWPVYNRSRGILGDLLNALPFATEHLLHALMKFYIEVENTGAHTQFYDKFSIRYEIFQIIKCVWSNTIYRERLSQEARINLDFFVRFVNLLLNDVTFVLDESLTAFLKIHKLSIELRNPSTNLEQAIRTEKEEALATAQNSAKSYMSLTNETVAMLKLFTEALADSFTMPEIVQRLADMLDYNLDAMVGPKSSDLKVENPTEYSFNPRALLAEIIDVYLNLKEKENFIFAVARDGRSYKPGNFEKAAAIMKRYVLKSPEELAAWRALGEKFKKAKELDDQAEEDLGEIPEEFLGSFSCFLEGAIYEY